MAIFVRLIPKELKVKKFQIFKIKDFFSILMENENGEKIDIASSDANNITMSLKAIENTMVFYNMMNERQSSSTNMYVKFAMSEIENYAVLFRDVFADNRKIVYPHDLFAYISIDIDLEIDKAHKGKNNTVDSVNYHFSNKDLRFFGNSRSPLATYFQQTRRYF